jgi:hypothetical protein
MDRVLEGTYGVFSVQNFWEVGYDREVQQGKTVADAAKAGAFAAIAFEHPNEWIGRELDLAGDEQTMPEIAETFSRVIGKEISYYQVPWDQFEEQMGEEYAVMYRWFNDVGYEADIAALRQEYPDLTSFEQYLRSHGWEGAELPTEG